jgi:hypothetical protein
LFLKFKNINLYFDVSINFIITLIYHSGNDPEIIS